MIARMRGIMKRRTLRRTCRRESMRSTIVAALAVALCGHLIAESENDIFKRYRESLATPSAKGIQGIKERALIIWELRSHKTARAVKLLRKVIAEDPAEDPRIYAAFALAEMGTKEAVDALLDVLAAESAGRRTPRRYSSLSAPDENNYKYFPDAVHAALRKVNGALLLERFGETIKRGGGDAVTVLRLVCDMGVKGLSEALGVLLEKTSKASLLCELLPAIEIGGDEALLKKALEKALQHKDWRVRTVAGALLDHLDADAALAYAKKLLVEKQWRVRSAAVEGLSAVKDKRVVDLLVETYQGAEGRLLDDIHRALVVLTAQSMGNDPLAWRDWWLANRGDFKFPEKPGDPDMVSGGKRSPEPRVEAPHGRGPRTFLAPRYYGMEVRSAHICFVLDISGSMEMRMKVEIDGKTYEGTKLEIAKGELKRCIGALPKKCSFNIIVFETGYRAWRKKLVKASKSGKNAAYRFIDEVKPGGDTNIYDPLRCAMQDESVDTIYLLSDGSPNAGAVPTAEGILREIRRVNRVSRVRINTIAFGEGAEVGFLKGLAHANAGRFVDKRGRAP